MRVALRGVAWREKQKHYRRLYTRHAMQRAAVMEISFYSYRQTSAITSIDGINEGTTCPHASGGIYSQLSRCQHVDSMSLDSY